VKVEINPIEGSAVKLDVSIPAELAKQEFNKACKRIGQRVSVPGFRRGKAPLRMIEKNVGVDAIKQEALDRYLPYIFADIISERKLDVVAPPRITSLEFDLESGITLSAEVDIRPEVKLPKLELSVEVEDVSPAKDAEEMELKSMLERAAELQIIESRDVVEATDVLELDFCGRLEGKEIPGGKAEAFELDLKNNHFLDSFTEQLPGKKVGETFTIDVQFPEDYFDAGLSGKIVAFEIKINALKQYVTPELTDETAKRIGNADTAEAVKTEIKERIQKRLDQEKTYRAQRALVEELIKQANVEIPKGLIQREVESMVSDFAERMKQQGLNFEEMTRGQNMHAEFQDEAKNRITTSLTFAEIAKQEGLSIQEHEFNDEVSNIAEAQGMEEKALIKRLAAQPQAVQALTDQLLAQKIVTMLMDRATIKWVPEGSLSKSEPALEGDDAPKAKASSKKPVAKAEETHSDKEEVVSASVAE
jgi:trigger factor